MKTATPALSRQAPAQAARIDHIETSVGGRIQSIDIVRGAVMLLMAIDHVRVYSGLPAGGPTPGIFLTRWITHFVAPAFIFLAGTSAFLHGRKLADTSSLARFLVTRGLWLVLLELTLLRVAWTFNFDFSHYLLAGVIWVIGWCMVLLAGLIFLPVRALATFGLAVVLGHNILDHFSQSLSATVQQSHWGWLCQILYFGGPIQIGRAWAHSVCAVFDCPLGRSDGAGLCVWTCNDHGPASASENLSGAWYHSHCSVSTLARV